PGGRPAAGDQVIGDEPERLPALVFVLDNRRGAEDDRAAVVHRVAEHRAGGDDPVEVGDGHADRLPVGRPERAVRRGPVQVQGVACAPVGGRQHGRHAVGHHAEVADEAGVEHLVEGGAIGLAARAVPAQGGAGRAGQGRGARVHGLGAHDPVAYEASGLAQRANHGEISMTTLPADLPLVVDRGGTTPLAVQISAQLHSSVTGGVLRAGDRLPSSRDLAATLGVSRTVVTNAYARLFAEGWLEGRHGSGTYVANVTPPLVPAAVTGVSGPVPGPGPGGAAEPAARAARAAIPPTASPPGLIDLQPGISWAEGIEPGAWRRAWRQAGAHLPSRWPDPHGLPELRAEIAAYLRRSRGLAVTPAHVLVTQGVSSGLALLADALLSPGDRAGIEEPGYATGREVLRRAGA